MRIWLPLSKAACSNAPTFSVLSSPSVRSYATQSRKGKEKAVDDPDPDGVWETVIGLEIHAQIRTARKLFSSASTSHNDPVNTHIDLVDAAVPGSLPMLNTHAVRLALNTAVALQCRINPRSTFDRKHYFYHDIPLSYQITQHYNPLARAGKLRIQARENGVQRDFDVGIQQLQVEQDTAKSQLVGENRMVDLNRAGTALMEIVTDPDMRTAEEAGAFVRRLQRLLRRLGSGDGDMEKGNLRVDANVSVHRRGSPFGTRCEVKNINSIRFLQAAINSERRRHIRHYLAEPHEPLQRETRGINEMTGETFSLRSKEDAEDYRYMPDANLPAMIASPTYLRKLAQSLPEQPWETVDRLISVYGVPQSDVDTLTALDEYDFAGVRHFEEAVGHRTDLGRRTLNLIVHDTLGLLIKAGRPWSADVVPPSLLREMVLAIEERKITGTTAKLVLTHLVKSDGPPPPSLDMLLDELGLQSATAMDLRAICTEAIAAQPKSAEAVRSGKTAAIGRLVGEVMKRTQGGADAQEARRTLFDILGVTDDA